MHELSIALAMIEKINEETARHGGGTVETVHLRIGVLSGVDCDALQFAYECAAQNTELATSKLDIESIPLLVYCPKCSNTHAPQIQQIFCPRCITPDQEILQGRELEVTSLEIARMKNEPRIVEVRARILKENDTLAHALRERFQQAGVSVISFVSSPGSGKTTFLEKLLGVLGANHRVAALVGDLATENDAARLSRACSQVRQITTGTICHLDAKMIDKALEGWNLSELDFLFIENVGNLVCPSSYDLGERMRVVLLSATEGEDKPLKYPTIFNTADIAIITKMDLAEACDFDRAAAHRSIHSVRPGMQIFEISSKTGQGMEAIVAALEAALQQSQPA